MAPGVGPQSQELIHSRLERVRRRLGLEVWLREAVVPLWCAATGVLLGRMLFRAPGLPLALGTGALLGAAWILRARARRVSRNRAAVLLDRLAGAGGLLLTGLERPMGDWAPSLDAKLMRAPPPEIHLARPGGLLALGTVFFAVALLTPLPTSRRPPANAAAASKVAQLEARVEAVSRVHPVEPNLRHELDRLRREVARGHFDGADWEAADQLSGILQQKASEASEQLSKAGRTAGALEKALASAAGRETVTRERESLEKQLLALSGGRAKSGPEALAQALAKANGSGASGSGHPGVAKTGATGATGRSGSSASVHGASGTSTRLSPAQIGALREALASRESALRSAFSESAESRSGQSGSGRMGKPSVGAGFEAMAAAHSGSQAGASESASETAGTSATVSGSGAPTRGGGAAKLSFGEQAQVDPSRLRFAPLPSGRGGRQPGILLGLDVANPHRFTGAAGPAVAEPAQVGGRASGGFSQGAKLPRNRALVRRYFDPGSAPAQAP